MLTTDLDLAVDAYWATTNRAAQGTKTDLTSALYEEQAALLAVVSAANEGHGRLSSGWRRPCSNGAVQTDRALRVDRARDRRPAKAAMGYPSAPAGGGAGGGGGGGAGGGAGGAGGGGGGSRVLGARATGGTRRNRESSGASSKRSKPDRREVLLARLAVLATGRGFRGRSLAVREAIVAQFESAESTRVRKTAAAIAYPEAAAASGAGVGRGGEGGGCEDGRGGGGGGREDGRGEGEGVLEGGGAGLEGGRGEGEGGLVRAEEAAARAAAAKEKEAARAAAAEEAAAARAEEAAVRAEEVAAQEATAAATLASLGGGRGEPWGTGGHPVPTTSGSGATGEREGGRDR